MQTRVESIRDDGSSVYRTDAFCCMPQCLCVVDLLEMRAYRMSIPGRQQWADCVYAIVSERGVGFLLFRINVSMW